MKHVRTGSWLMLLVIVGTGFVGLSWPATALADGLRAVPFEFVGKAGDCGPGYPAGSRIVTAAWLTGMGLPDNGGANSNAVNPADNPNKKDPHTGLLLSKNGPTSDCSSAGVVIKGAKGMTLSATSALGFDYRNGGHCGGGAPRFNVLVKNSLTLTDTFHFVGGCANDTSPTPTPQDPTQWTRVRFQTFSSAEAFPPIPPGSTIKSISIVYDEGTDTPSVQDPNGVGLAVLDNICINGRLAARGEAEEKGHGSDDKHHGSDDKDNNDDDDDDNGVGNDQICQGGGD